MSSRIRHPLVIGILGIGLISLGAALALTRDREPASLTVAAGADVPVTEEVHSLEAHNSPTIAQNPEDPDRLIIADKIDRPGFSAALHVSDDGGGSWSEVEFPTPPEEDRPYAPDLAWGPDGTVYLTFVTLTGRGNNPEAAWLTTSADGGGTWSEPRRVLGPWTFQLRVAADPANGRLYLTWLQADRESVGTLSFVETGLPILAASSEDGGETWSEPVRVNPTERERVGAAVPVVGPDGDLNVLYYDFKDDRFDWENLEGGVYQGTFELVLARSEPGRLEFDHHVVAPDITPFERFLVYLPKFPSLVIASSTGDLYASWSDGEGGDADVLVSRSEDSGMTWSEPVAVHDQSDGDQYMAKLAIAPNGRIDVVYLNRTDHDGEEAVAAYFATTFDGARTWSSIVLSTDAFSAAVGPEGPETEALGRADQATRAALVSNDGESFAAWTDARNGTLVTGRLDIYFARVEFSAE
jgi:hypothetical protein